MFSLIAALLFPAPPQAPRVLVQASVERRVDHVHYHFANPSSIDTVDSVPHFFEQRYDASNTWIALAAAYRLAGGTARTSVAFAPSIATSGSDIDTFFDPTGDVVTSGTTGDVTLGSVAIDQRFGLAVRGRWTFGVALGYRRSRAVFHPAFIVVTHPQPPSSSSTFTTSRETTTSQVIESGVTGASRWPFGAWTMTATIDVLPLTVGRLTTVLPDKTPPLDTTGQALAFGAKGEIAMERAWGPVVAGAGLTIGGAWSYGPSSAYRERGAGVVVFVRSGS